MTRDVSAFQIAQIHFNICVGMIGACVQDKPALQPVLDQLMSFEAIGSIFITELGHGLDVKNIETTATLLPDGCFDLHTPSENAAKAMPPAAPVIGMKRIGIVLAKLIVDEQDRGLKLFVVPISDRDKMYSGVTTWLLPVRPGTKPLDHAITAFNHVRLPPESVLSSLAKPKDAQLDLHHQLWRLSVGAIALSIGNLNCLQVGTYIAAVYSKRRMVQQNSQMGRVPIISFSTQYRPILQSLAAGEVLRAMTDWCIDIFRNPSISLHLRRGIAIVYKAVVIHHFALLSELSERCGWRGYYGHNQIAEMYLSFAANAD
ncbi:Acyl-coenzyme A oxidase-like protein [Beauveria bassiana]|nr:Acyl-coenzyme A oxidase-like protein [Beauveria bassiana]